MVHLIVIHPALRRFGGAKSTKESAWSILVPMVFGLVRPLVKLIRDESRHSPCRVSTIYGAVARSFWMFIRRDALQIFPLRGCSWRCFSSSHVAAHLLERHRNFRFDRKLLDAGGRCDIMRDCDGSFFYIFLGNLCLNKWWYFRKVLTVIGWTTFE